MARMISILLVLLMASQAWAFPPVMMGASAGAAAAGPVYTDCSTIDTAAFMWNGDHASGNTYGCKNSTTTVNGTFTTPTIVVSTDEPGTASPDSAENVLDFATTGHYARWAVTTGDIFASDEGRVCMDVYLTETTGNNMLWNTNKDGDDFHQFIVQADNTIKFTHSAGGVVVSVISSGTLSNTTWTNVCARWSATYDNGGEGKGVVSVKVGTGAWVNDIDGDAVAAFASGEPSYIYIGNSTVSNEFYIDNIFVWKTSGL